MQWASVCACVFFLRTKTKYISKALGRNIMCNVLSINQNIDVSWSLIVAAHHTLCFTKWIHLKITATRCCYHYNFWILFFMPSSCLVSKQSQCVFHEMRISMTVQSSNDCRISFNKMFISEIQIFWMHSWSLNSSKTLLSIFTPSLCHIAKRGPNASK